MRRFVGSGICMGVILHCLSLSPCGAFSEAAKRAGEPEKRVLAVLDPIDLHIMRADPDWGDFLRRGFASNSGWKVITRDTMIAKMKEYRIDARVPCHEFQCAFDAGNVLSAEFVIFWSITSLDDLYAYTLNLVHVPTSQTVWSRVGEVSKRQLGDPGAAMESALAQISDWLGPDKVRTGRREKLGQLTVLDLSAAGSTPARVMAERVATHLYSSRNYDIMGKKEQDELLTALGIEKSAFIPTDSAINLLGTKMGISHLVYSRLLATKNGAMQLRLALYDVASRQKVRERPSQPTQDFRKLLQFEESFFSSLFRVPGSEDPGSISAGRKRWTWAGAAASLAFGAVCGYLSYSASKDADRAYARFQEARSREAVESWAASAKGSDRSAFTWAILGGVGVAGAGGLVVLSF